MIESRHGSYSAMIAGSNAGVGRDDHSQLKFAVSSSNNIVHVMPQERFRMWRVVFTAF